jgi:DNA primase
MGRISDEDVARVRDATDVVTLIQERVLLRQKGRLFWGLCPFHGEKTPSFKVDPATQLWHCFGCGLGGDVFGFTMKMDNVDFPDAIRLLADRANVDIHETEGGAPRGHKERLYAALDEAAEFYHHVLTSSREKDPAAARDYLSARGFGSEVAKSWRLGFAPGRGALVRHLTERGFSGDEIVDANLAFRGDKGLLKDRFYDRIMFPIGDLQGRSVAFGGRVLGAGEPKYLNTNDTPVFHKSASMYGIDRAKGPITANGTAVVVEGYTDVIALHAAGLTNAVATLGTALTKQHVKLLGRFAKRIVYLFDGDEAGMRAADRAAEFIDATVTPESGASQVVVDVAVIPDGHDPADYVGSAGAEGMREVIEEAQPLLRFAIERRLSRWDLERPEERSRALKDAAEVLAPVKDSMLADDYANYIADRLFADFAVVRRAIAQVKSPLKHPDAEDAQSAPVLDRPLTAQQRAERDLLGLMVSVPFVRGEAQELLTESLLEDPAHQSIAAVIVEAGSSVSPSALVALLEQRVPGSAELLSAVDAGETTDHAAREIAQDSVRRLKEFALERRIAQGKSRLKNSESFKESSDYDELFREVSELQRALDRLRRAAGDMS